MPMPTWLSSAISAVGQAIPAIVGLFSSTPKPREPAPPADNFDAIDAGVDAELKKRREAEAAAAKPSEGK